MVAGIISIAVRHVLAAKSVKTMFAPALMAMPHVMVIVAPLARNVIQAASRLIVVHRIVREKLAAVMAAVDLAAAALKERLVGIVAAVIVPAIYFAGLAISAVLTDWNVITALAAVLNVMELNAAVMAAVDLAVRVPKGKDAGQGKMQGNAGFMMPSVLIPTGEVRY
jgi:hypothetical protein